MRQRRFATDIQRAPNMTTKGTVRTDGFRQAIVTKYHGPTDRRGSRVSATAQAGRIYLEWDDALGRDENHAAACLAYATKFGWLDYNDFVAGGLPDGSTVWVAVPLPRGNA